MLTDLHIENFRCFPDLKIQGLARVNLIVGGNNSGKTTVLEALAMVLTSPGTWGDQAHGLPSLFRSSRANQGHHSEFWDWLLSSPSAHQECLIQAAVPDWLDRIRVVRPTGTYPSQPTWTLDWTGELGSLGQRQVCGTQPNDGDRIATFSTFPTDPKKDAVDFNRVVLKRRRRQVEGLLKEIEPRLESIESLQSDEGGPSLYADIGLPLLIPVTQLGQGFNRLLDIYSEIVAEEAKILLIDEIENGLYWKMLPVVWKGLFAAANQLDVQIFATTHSAECIRAADEAARNNGHYDLAVIRLDRVDNEIKATVMGEETLRTAKEFGWEMR
jgi:energy-coupling factor transporter ATP-binding protein EcfA2